jgi:hypothetical protein
MRDDLARSPGEERHIHRCGLVLIHEMPNLISAVLFEASAFRVWFVLAHDELSRRLVS